MSRQVKDIFFFLYVFFKVIAENLSDEEVKGLTQMFNNMDTDRNGTITYAELRDGLSRLGSKLTEAEIKQLLDAVRTLWLSHFFIFSFTYITV